MKTDQVTVLVFKDNLSARTFKIPLGWFSRLGVLIAVCIGLTILTSIIALKYYIAMRHVNPTRVMQLEQALTDLNASRQELEAKLTTNKTTQEAAPTQITPTSAPTSPTFAIPSAPKIGIPPGSASLPFIVNTPRIFWTGNQLQMHFSIQYIGQDGGNQQGRIIVLARGTETLLAYPNGVLNLSENDSLMDPQKGEFFSVSHYREVKAILGPISAHSMVREAQIFIFDKSGHPLLTEKISMDQATTKPASRRKTTPAVSTPSASTNELIEPGVDQ